MHCGLVSKHIFSCTIYDHPRVLFVSVNRYTLSSSYARARKDCRKIRMDEVMELYGQRYRLGGIITHLGASVDSGHYTACVERNGALYTCSDSVVQKTKSFPSQSFDVYLLFYIKESGS